MGAQKRTDERISKAASLAKSIIYIFGACDALIHQINGFAQQRRLQPIHNVSGNLFFKYNRRLSKLLHEFTCCLHRTGSCTLSTNYFNKRNKVNR